MKVNVNSLKLLNVVGEKKIRFLNSHLMLGKFSITKTITIVYFVMVFDVICVRAERTITQHHIIYSLNKMQIIFNWLQIGIDYVIFTFLLKNEL